MHAKRFGPNRSKTDLGENVVKSGTILDWPDLLLSGRSGRLILQTAFLRYYQVLPSICDESGKVRQGAILSNQK